MTAPDTSTAPTVPPVIGKRCRLRNGEVTGPMQNRDGTRSPYLFFASMPNGGGYTWTAEGVYDISSRPHNLDIIAVLDDAEPVAAKGPEVAAFTGYEFGAARAFVGARIYIRHTDDMIGLTPAEARALLQVLPAMIEIAEGQA